MERKHIFEGLNPEQRRAVEAVRGPVCILAGAGSGKTTTITHRIANQVATGAFRADEILAVTFTDKAATQMRSRLATLGVTGVAARTFHSAALAQLHFFAPERVGRILGSKALLLRQIGNTLPAPYRYRPAGDLATEVEWAKNRRLTPATYRASLGDHVPPMPPELAELVFQEYERRKEAAGAIDFEDLLELTLQTFDDDERSLIAFRERYRAFTVDEYQDVNLLQQSLLDRWLGSSDELCAVGDDYQSIFGFTGATPEYLLAMPDRFSRATVVRLERNYRSSPQVLALANRLVPKLHGAEKTLVATRPEGPEPEVLRCVDNDEQCAKIVERVHALHDGGIAYEEMAILFRLNARSAELEEALTRAQIPFQGASLLARDAAKQLLKVLSRRRALPAAETVRAAALELGWVGKPQEGLGEREQTRQTDLGLLVRLAAEGGDADVSAFVSELEERFGSDGVDRRGVHLLTLHRAKGLEFEAVFLPRVEDKELPARQARTEAGRAEERRLLYVGLTRAKRHLLLAWSGRPSPFLAELGFEARPVARARAPGDRPPAFEALRRWRLQRAKSDEIPPYVVFHDSTLEELVARRPSSVAELRAVSGVGETKVERYGRDVLQVLGGLADDAFVNR
jgi:DNA helicase II / ATP-dependent DNA helicase PcrA